MTDYDEKTQVWILRTQAIPRTPALRGGVPTDRRARRQTAAGVAAVLVVLSVLCLAPSRPRTAAPAAGVPRASARSSDSPALPVTEDLSEWLGADTSRMPDSRPANTGVSELPPLSGHVPPPAPVWLDHPGSAAR